MEECNPIFILGISRSGTSLITRILDRHPNISIYMETNFFERVWEKSDDKFIWDEETFEKTLCEISHLDREGINIKSVKEGFFKTNRYLMALFDEIIKNKMINNTKKRFGEKTPSENLLYLETLLDYYQNANLIFIFRDPRNVYS